MLKCDANHISPGSNSDLDRFCHPALLRDPRPANACVGYRRLPAAHLFESAIRDAQAAMHIVILRSQQHPHQQVWQRPYVLAPDCMGYRVEHITTYQRFVIDKIVNAGGYWLRQRGNNGAGHIPNPDLR